MTEIGFYHLTRSGLDRALPQLLQKTMEAGKRALVVLGSDERVHWFDDYLWTYDSASWMPHGSARDGEPEMQPVWLDTSDANPNNAEFLFLADGGASARVGDFERCFDLFDGQDEDAVTEARARWKALKDAGHELTYWQQGERGWEKKA
ncbi:DNA polymerase III subunit chi [Thalassospiraceae bacterium LMO-JJ14]|nr:DNA polymerase III subunit chi [Thalassospiraceae bacterium LMO-JJ14]